MGLLHYESFISSYKLFITPAIGEADSDLLMERRKSDDSLWWITEQYLPRQPEKLSSPEQATSDQWHMGLWGEGTLTPTGHQEYWENPCVSKLMCPRGCGHPHTSTSFLTLLKTWLIWTQQGSVYLESVNLSSSLLPHSMSPSMNTVMLSEAALTNHHTHTHTHPQPPCWTPGDSSRSLKVRVEGQKGSGEGGTITMVPHGYLNMS